MAAIEIRMKPNNLKKTYKKKEIPNSEHLIRDNLLLGHHAKNNKIRRNRCKSLFVTLFHFGSRAAEKMNFHIRE